MVIHVAIILGVAGVWEAIANSGLVSRLILSSIQSIVSFGGDYYPTVLANMRPTFIEIGYSIALVLPLGIVLGVVFGYVNTLDRVFTPILTAAFAVPSFIFYPLMIAWFGLGTWSKVALAFSIGFFPLILNTIVGVRTINRTYIDFARSLGLRKFGIIRRIIIPFATPTIIGSIRISLAFIVIGVIVGEMLGGYDGLGTQISRYQNELVVPGVYFVVLLVFLIVVALLVGMGYLESMIKKRIPL